MMRMALVLALLVNPLLAAQEELYPSAAVGSRWLNVPGNARVAALAGAFVARGAEPGALESNRFAGRPTGLAGAVHP
jgi:hypothetical protein